MLSGLYKAGGDRRMIVPIVYLCGHIESWVSPGWNKHFIEDVKSHACQRCVDREFPGNPYDFDIPLVWHTDGNIPQS